MKMKVIPNQTVLSVILTFILFIRYIEAIPLNPNILLLVVDDLGWNDLSYTGNDFVSTPNIDTLSKEGVKLSNYYVQPLCSPSRSALLSGYHPIHTGMQHNVIAADEPWGLPASFKILPQYLKSLNYSTHLIGKWHQGFYSKNLIPNERGFDSYVGYLSGASDYYDRITRSNGKWGLDWYENENQAAERYGFNYSTDIFTTETIKLIESEHTQPWFIEVAYQAVHIANSPKLYQVPIDYLNRFSYIKDVNLRSYAALLTSLDDSIGTIFNALHSTGQANSTLIIFTSDNGAPTGTLNGRTLNLGVGSNQPLRGAKYTLWEGGIKGLSWVWGNWLKSKGTIYTGLSHISDWLPTIYSFAGGNVTELPSNIYGINLKNELQDNWSHDNEINDNIYSLRNELLHNIDDIWKVSSIRIGDYKLVYGTVFDGQFDDWVTRNLTKNVKQSRIDNNQLSPSSLNIPSATTISSSSSWITLNQSLYELDPESIKRPYGYMIINCNNQTRTFCDPSSEPCLFNINHDPCEYNNIASSNQQIVKQLMIRLNDLRQTAVKPTYKPGDAKASPVLHHGYWTWWLS